MPSKEQTVDDAIRLFEAAHYPGELAPETAWLGIYQVLLWYVQVGIAGIVSLPHIIDSDKLRPAASKAKKLVPGSPSAWQRRALAVEQHLGSTLSVSADRVPDHFGLLFKQPDYQMQKQNPLGTAFAGLVKHVLVRFGNRAIEYQLEVDANSIFPGILMTGRSKRPLIDILVLKDGLPRAIISSKWGVRHDRINEITNECPIYKAAALRMRNPLDFYVVTNEFDPARLAKIISDPCINALVHVHRPIITEVCGFNDRLGNLFDLADLVKLTNLW